MSQHAWVGLDDISEKVLTAFRRCVPAGRWLYALYWQHPCYRLYPHSVSLPPRSSDWRIPVMPDGDSCIFLDAALVNGLFGHPWKQTICVFGQDMLDALAASPPIASMEPIRSGDWHAGRRAWRVPIRVVGSTAVVTGLHAQ